MARRGLEGALSLLVCLAAASCTGSINEMSPPGGGDDATGGTGTPGDPPKVRDPAGLPGPALAAKGGMRRLTVDEYKRTILQVIGIVIDAGPILPNEKRAPFDNDYTTQETSSSLITAAELLAGDIANKLLADKPKRDRLVGCTPAGATDTACLRQFITSFGRMAWRRSLAAEDVQDMMTTVQSLTKGDTNFYSAVDAAIRLFLQDPEFLFRVEVGKQVSPGLFKLTGPEMATRLSYFLWGSAPDDGLLKVAESGGLDTSEGVRLAASDMLARPDAQKRIARFHALWMGYDSTATAGMAGAMKAETDHLLSRVIFEKKVPWQELFRSPETYVNGALATHYGLTPTAKLKASASASDWLPYTGTERRGLLSQASFLSLAKTDNEKQMTIRRGKAIRELLFCKPLPPKPNNVGSPGETPKSPCKPDFLEPHSKSAACSFCHTLMDPVGFGLDRYDGQGKYRTEQYWVFADAEKKQTELSQAGAPGAVRCVISGEGELDGKTFNGPAQLSDLVLASPDLNTCATKQLYRFIMGRTEIDDVDQQFLDLMAKRMGTDDFRFDDLVLDFVSSGAFAHRRQGI